MYRFFAAALAMAALALPAAADTAWKKLLSPAELAAFPTETAPLIVDIRPPKSYLTANVPGSVSAPYGLWRGPVDNPGQLISDAHLTKVLQGIGVVPESRVVIVYAGTDQTDFGAAARVYWTLKSAGLTEIAILNGGIRSWIAEEMPLSVEPTKPTPSSAQFALSSDWMADRAEIAAAVAGDGGLTLIDARPSAQFAGKAKHPKAAKPGTLAGARSLPHEGWFEGAATEIAPAARIAELAEAAGVGADAAPVASFCNTGHWAATNWFAMSELAGVEGVKLYPESMVGWTRAGGPVISGE